DLDAFDARIAASAAPIADEAAKAAAISMLGRGLRIELAAPGDQAQAWAALTHGALDGAYGGYSIWSTIGSVTQAPACLAFSRLPPAESFAGLLDGRFDRASDGAAPMDV